MRLKSEAEFEFDFNDENTAKVIYESVKKEAESLHEGLRSFVTLNLKGKKLNLYICTKDIVTLRAATNTWLRLIKISEEMIKVIKEFRKAPPLIPTFSK